MFARTAIDPVLLLQKKEDPLEIGRLMQSARVNRHLVETAAQSGMVACKSAPLRSFPRLMMIAAPTKDTDATAASAFAYDMRSAIKASTKAALAANITPNW